MDRDHWKLDLKSLLPASQAFLAGSGSAVALHTFPIVGGVPEAISAPSAAGGNIERVHISEVQDAAWAAVRQHPYGFTCDSICISSAAVSALWLTCQVNAPASLTSPLRVQYLQDVLVVDTLDASGGVQGASSFVPIKRTLGPTRVLVICGPGEVVRGASAPPKDCPSSTLSVAAPSSTLDRLALCRVLGIATSDQSAAVERPQVVDALLVALLAWLKDTTRTWARESGAGTGSFVLAVSGSELSLRIDTGSNSSATGGVGSSGQEPLPLISATAIGGLFMAAGAAAPRPALKRPRPADAPASELHGQSRVPPSQRTAQVSGQGQGVRLAIIVPFRDQPEQNRGEQLRRFSAHLPALLSSTAVQPPLASYHILVAEQSSDGLKFNRGKLLNAGFALATHPDREQLYGLPAHGFNAFCFHDVDLLPGPALGPWYARMPSPSPLHLGAAWQRYPYESYVGGILTMDEAAVRATNGFPNDFWGWGGEDDELSTRLREARLLPLAKPGPEITTNPGALVDLEELLIIERGGQRAGTSVKDGGRTEWRNMWKREGLARHEATWRTNGVNSLAYSVIAMRHPVQGVPVTVFTLDLKGGADPHAQKQEYSEPLPEAGRR